MRLRRFYLIRYKRRMSCISYYRSNGENISCINIRRISIWWLRYSRFKVLRGKNLTCTYYHIHYCQHAFLRCHSFCFRFRSRYSSGLHTLPASGQFHRQTFVLWILLSKDIPHYWPVELVGWLRNATAAYCGLSGTRADSIYAGVNASFFNPPEYVI